MLSTLHITCDAPASPLVNKTIDIFRRRVTERCGAGVMNAGNNDGCTVALSIAKGIGVEGFRIESLDRRSGASAGDSGGPSGGVRIVGNDERGLLYGVGKFLRGCRLEPGRFEPSVWRGTSIPKRPVRGIYFASHFHNFYHDAPIDQVQRYVEELALWGCNTLAVWYDMHHFKGIDDPAAVAMIDRLKRILRAANDAGIGAAFVSLSNEAYAGSPPHLRAMPFPWHYHVELCPSKPEGLDLILKWRREMLEAFRDVRTEYFWIWPYDQGGCKCEACAPWGCNGFLRNAEPVARLVRELAPQAKVVLSTWCFDYWDKVEWPGLAKAFEKRPDWVDFIMADSHGEFPKWPLEHGVPGGLPMVNFPEISMFNNGPWGGFGAVPAPARFQKFWDSAGHLLAGGFPYSEGIYEDMNKAINLQHYWGDQPALETIREYAAGEYGLEVADEVVAIVQRLEAAQHHSVTELARKPAQWGEKLTAPIYHLPAAKPDTARATAERVLAVERRLSPAAAGAWRWRVLCCRAILDAELSASGGLPTPQAEACFEELTRIYHAENAEGCVLPPSYRRLSGGKIPSSW